MPIYAYRCSTCGRAKDVLQKMSDPLLSECPFCGAPTFVKQVTAAGFQLKGSGWYVTDFRGDSKAPKPADGDASRESAKGDGKEGGEGKAGDGKAADGATAAPAASASKGDSASTPAAAAPAAAAPSASSTGSAGAAGPASK